MLPLPQPISSQLTQSDAKCHQTSSSLSGGTKSEDWNNRDQTVPRLIGKQSIDFRENLELFWCNFSLVKRLYLFRRLRDYVKILAFSTIDLKSIGHCDSAAFLTSGHNLYCQPRCCSPIRLRSYILVITGLGVFDITGAVPCRWHACYQVWFVVTSIATTFYHQSSPIFLVNKQSW